MSAAGDEMADCLANEGQIFFCGNGGSAAAAQHIAAELSGRLVRDRRPLAGIALTADTAAITAIANDYGYDQVFARQIHALAVGRGFHCLVILSTSGNSPNILEAVKAAHFQGMPVIGLFGRTGGKARELCAPDGRSVAICVPSDSTARIQEAHEFIGHALVAHVEAKLGL